MVADSFTYKIDAQIRVLARTVIHANVGPTVEIAIGRRAVDPFHPFGIDEVIQWAVWQDAVFHYRNRPNLEIET